MTVRRLSRRRFCTFCDLALVSKAMSPSRNPYHIATSWILPPAPMVAIDMEWRSWRNASISASLILIVARWLTPMPEVLTPPRRSGARQLRAGAVPGRDPTTVLVPLAGDGRQRHVGLQRPACRREVEAVDVAHGHRMAGRVGQAGGVGAARPRDHAPV